MNVVLRDIYVVWHLVKQEQKNKYLLHNKLPKKPETAYLLHKSKKVEELYPCQCIIIKYQWTLSQTAHCSAINSQC